MPEKKKPVVVVTRKLPDVIETRMRELFDARLNMDDQPMSRAELVDAVQTAQVLVPTVTDLVDSSVIEQAGSRARTLAETAGSLKRDRRLHSVSLLPPLPFAGYRPFRPWSGG